MTAAVAENGERGADVEDQACQHWSLEHVDDVDWHDLEVATDVVADLSPEPIAAEGTQVEVKSCFPDYADRAGRWWIRREYHERLVDADGVYVLAVVERTTERVRRMALVDASTVDAIVDGKWWDAGNGGKAADEYRRIPWTDVFESLQDPGGEA